MKKWMMYAAFALPVLMVSCKALDKLTQFDLDYSTSYTYEANTPPNTPDSVATPDITTNIERELEIKESKKELIESAKLKEMKLQLNSDAGTRFTFLKSVDLYVSAPGREKVLVAYKHGITDDIGTELVLDLTNVELRDYVKNDVITLHATSVTDQLIRRNITVDVKVKFFVDAKILGI